MLYAVLPFLAAFPHVLYQSNIFLPIFMLLGFPLSINGVNASLTASAEVMYSASMVETAIVD